MLFTIKHKWVYGSERVICVGHDIALKGGGGAKARLTSALKPK